MQTADSKTNAGKAVLQRRGSLQLLLIGAIVVLSLGRAWAHAVIVESTPTVNGVVTGPALDIKLRFNSRIDSGRSKLTLIAPDSSSRTVSLAQQTAPDLLSAKVQGLTAGKYQLHWQVLASDGHITQGNIPFIVVNP